MSGFRDANVNKAANYPKKHLPIALVTAVSQTSTVAFSFTPGYRFQIVSARTYNAALAGTCTAVVKVGGRVAANVTFTSATEVAQTLSTTVANLRGSSTDAITIEYTTNGSGALTNGFIVLTIRPWPLNGDLGS